MASLSKRPRTVPIHVPGDVGFPHVQFDYPDQKKKFVALAKTPMSPTYFLLTPTLEDMGIADSMAASLTHTDFPTLYGMGESTYLDLTPNF